MSEAFTEQLKAINIEEEPAVVQAVSKTAALCMGEMIAAFENSETDEVPSAFHGEMTFAEMPGYMLRVTVELEETNQ